MLSREVITTNFLTRDLIHDWLLCAPTLYLRAMEVGLSWSKTSMWGNGLKCFIWNHTMSICDVMRENLAYGGANSVFLVQPLPNIYIHRLFFSCRKQEKCFSTDACMWQKVQAQIRHQAEGAASDWNLFFLFLHKPVFPRWRHICINQSQDRTIDYLLSLPCRRH